MSSILLFTFLLSLSPFGEARAGIIYAVFNDVHVSMAFIVGLVANLLVYPLFILLIRLFNQRLWSFKIYKRSVIYLCRFAKKSMGNKIEKYGFWGLMVFVMVPLPGTGAYMGTIAASIMRINNRSAFLAISLGTLISCLIMAGSVYLGTRGLSLFQ